MARILIAEDEKMLGTYLAAALGNLGHEVYVSPDGKHALETLQNNAGFDLLISDIKMPKMDGRQLIESVLQQEELADIPIIIMSGYVRISEIADLLKAGARAFLTKPVSLKELEEYVDQVLKCRRPMHSETSLQETV